MQFMLCSIDFNDSVAVLTLLYLLLAHTGSLGCNYSERALVLNPEVLPCQYLCTTLLSRFSVTFTTLSFFLLSLQAPSSRTCHKFFLLSQSPDFIPQHHSLTIRPPTFTFICPTLLVSIPLERILDKYPGTSCQAL